MPVSDDELASIATELYARAEDGPDGILSTNLLVLQRLLRNAGLAIEVLLERQKRTQIEWPTSPGEIAYHLRVATHDFDGGEGADNEPAIHEVYCGVLRQAADQLDYLDQLVTPFKEIT